jgi:hypothetical protein
LSRQSDGSPSGVLSEGSDTSASAEVHGKAVMTRKQIEGDASIVCFDERDDADFIRDVRVSSPQSCGLVGGSTVGWPNASFLGRETGLWRRDGGGDSTCVENLPQVRKVRRLGISGVQLKKQAVCALTKST